MDIRSLTLFCQLADNLHFAKTAQAMHTSAPTLSRAIQRLEQECNTQLLVRNQRKVQLTAAGVQFLRFAEQTLQNWQTLQQNFQQQAEQLSGELRLFCSVTASQSHLPALLAQFRQDYPQIDLKLTTGDPAQAEQLVLSEQVELAIALHYKPYPAKLAFYPLDNLPLVVIAPRNQAGITTENWGQQPWLLPESGPTRELQLAWFARQGIQPPIYAQVAGNEAIVSMVALGCAVGLVPQVVLENSNVRNKVQSWLMPDITPLQLGLCCLKTSSHQPIVKALLDSQRAKRASMRSNAR